jgi:hypothetical protein
MNIFDAHISGSLSVSSSAEISGNLTVLGTINATVSGTTTNALTASEAPKYTLTSSFHQFTSSYTTGSFTGSFKGDGTNLYNIPASGVTGLNLTQIADGVATASISNSNGLRVNSNTEITGALTISGSITLNGVPVGTGKLDETTFQSYTSSNDSTNTTQNSRLTSIEGVTGSVSLLNTYTGSNNTVIGTLQTSTSSLNTFTSSIDTTIKNKLNTETVISGSVQVLITGTTGYSTFSSSVSTSIGSLSGSVATTTSGLSSSVGSLSSSIETTTSGLSSSIGSLSSSVATTTSGLGSSLSSSIGSLSSSVATTTLGLSSSIGSLSSSIATTDSNQDGKLTSLESYTGSNNTVIGTLQTSTGSLNSYTSSNTTNINAIHTATSSLNTFTSSFNTSFGLSGADVTVKGNLTISGTTTTVNSTTVEIGDNIIQLNGTGATNAGLVVRDATAPNTVSGSLLWDSTNDNWIAGALGSEQRLVRETEFNNAVTRVGNVETSTGSLNSFTSSINTTIKSKLNTEGVVSGSAQITLSSTIGYGSVINQAVLTTSTPTFSTVSATTFTGALSGNATTATTAGALTSMNISQFTNNSAYLTSITSGNVTTALGFTPYNATNPSGYISSITSGNVTTALGFTPYNATNPSGYISSITSGNVTTALGFTPYNATNPSAYISLTALSFTAGSGAYNNTTGVITIPTNNNQITNGAGYITSAGTATNVSGIVAIANGGTGASTTSTARTNLGLAIGTDVLAYRTFGTAAASNTGDFAAYNATHYIGTTAIAANRASASQTLTGVSIDGNAATVTNFSGTHSGNSSGTNTGDQTNISGTAAYATQWGTSAGYANFSSTAISTSVGWLFGTTGNGTYAPVSLASTATLLGLGSLAYSSATIPTNNNQLTNGSGYITSAGTATNVSGIVAIANGGTGGTTAATARTNLGLAIGSDVLAYRTFGTAAASATGDFATYNATHYVGTTAIAANRASASQTLTGVSIDGTAGNITAYTINQSVGTGNSPTFVDLYARSHFIQRNANTTHGISWYSSGYTAWCQYMATVNVASTGPTGNITSPAAGNFVTSWALRSFIENVSGYGWTWEAGASTGQPSIVAEMSSATGNFYTKGSITVGGIFTENSSIRYKTNVETIKYGLDKILQMRGVTYTRKDSGNIEAGVIAEEMYDVTPLVVLKNKDGEVDSVSYGRINAYLIEAVKELKQEINEQNLIITELKGKLGL